jgi:glutathione S-transferase
VTLSLHIGNKNYSSWSMRPWVLMRQAGIDFHEHLIRFDSFEADSHFKKTITAINPAGKVPLLTDDFMGGLVVWDTLAICEYLAEKFPDKHLWPADAAARARARSICAEMHSGFGALRQHFPMNIEASLPEIGQLVLRDHAEVRRDVARVVEMWTGLLRRSGGPMLFGQFSIADAFYAPLCMRLATYAVPVPAEVAAYMQRVRELPGVAAWITDALAEHDFLPFEEPYRLHR